MQNATKQINKLKHKSVCRTRAVNTSFWQFFEHFMGRNLDKCLLDFINRFALQRKLLK